MSKASGWFLEPGVSANIYSMDSIWNSLRKVKTSLHLSILWFFKSHATMVCTRQIQSPEPTSTFLPIELNRCKESSLSMYSQTLFEHQTLFPSSSSLPSSFANCNVWAILQERNKTTQNYTTTSYSLISPFPSILLQCIISPNLPRPILPRRRLTRVLAPILLARSHPRIIRTLEHLRRRIQSRPRITILSLTIISRSRFTLRLIIEPVPW